MKKLLLFFSIFLSGIFLLNAQNWNEIKRLPNAYSTAINGNYAVVGNSDLGIKGIVYVLFYDGTNWTSVAELTASDGAVGDRFGITVGISGDHIVVGSTLAEDKVIDAGAAYVFTKPTNGWVTTTQETAKLTASDGAANDNFGGSVSIFGDNIVIGARSKSKGRGAAYVFTKPTAGWATAQETAKITASIRDTWDTFGSSVSISEDYIVVGSDGNGGRSNIGAAYVFTKPTTGWTTTAQETAKLTASDGTADDKFGGSVSIFKDNIVIGATEEGLGSGKKNSGAAYVYTKPTNGWVTTAQETAKITASNAKNGKYFGSSVGISGNHIVVGSRDSDVAVPLMTDVGSAYVYTKPTNGWATTAQETIELTHSNPIKKDYFGSSVSISGNHILVGGPGDASSGTSSAVYFFNQECTPNSIDITIANATPTLTANETGATYRWLDCDNGNAIIPAETNIAFSATVTGNYAVEITVGSCVDTSACENVVISAVNENDLAAGLSIYPNPTKGIFTISLATTTGNSVMTVYDMLGKTITSQQLTTTNTVIDLTGNVKGVYFINIQTNQENVIRKVILQ